MMSRVSALFLHWSALGWLVVGQRSKSLQTWNRLISTHGRHAPWVSSRAHLLAELDQHDLALQDYDWLCQQPQASAADWFNRGFLLEQKQDLPRAAESFERSIAMDPELDRAWYGLGLCRLRLGQLEQACVALRRNTQLQPMSPHGWVQLARIHEKRQEPEEVLKIIRHLQGFEPQVAAELMRETGIQLQPGRA